MIAPSASTPLMRVCAENGRNSRIRHVASAHGEAILGQHHDGAALGRFVRQGGKLRGIRQLAFVHARRRNERHGLPVAQRDCAGLVEQQDINIAGRLDRTAGRGQHVEPHEPVHPRNADRRKKAADGRRDQRDEQRRQRHGADDATRVGREGRNGRDRHHEDQRQAGQEHAERDLVRRLAARRALNQRNHAIEESVALRRRDLDRDPVGQDARSGRDGRTIAARPRE